MARIEINPDKCVSSAACVLAAPDLFDQDDEGVVVVLEANVGPGDEARARNAAALCPAAVITVRSGMDAR